MICPNCGHDSGKGRPPLTKRQRQVFEFVRSNIEDWGYAPSLTEIAAWCGMRAISTAHEHLTYLERKGYIRRVGKGAPRNVQVV